MRTSDYSVNILGIEISRLSMADTLYVVRRYISSRSPHYIVVPNCYCFTEARRDPEYKEALNQADLAIPDGTPLVWASKILGCPAAERIAGPDFFNVLNKVAKDENYSIFLLGGGPGGSEKAAESLSNRLPGLRIVGTFSPPFGPVVGPLNEEIVKSVNKAQPDVLWVGLGSPRQEKWMYKNISRIKAKVAVGVGAAFWYEVGRMKRAPAWMRNNGLEWLHHIVIDDFSLLWRKRYYAYAYEFMLPVLFQAITKRFSRV